MNWWWKAAQRVAVPIKRHINSKKKRGQPYISQWLWSDILEFFYFTILLCWIDHDNVTESRRQGHSFHPAPVQAAVMAAARAEGWRANPGSGRQPRASLVLLCQLVASAHSFGVHVDLGWEVLIQKQRNVWLKFNNLITLIQLALT